MQAEAAALEPGVPFTLGVRQPWAHKVAEVAELTEEQKEYMAKVGCFGVAELKDGAFGMERLFWRACRGAEGVHGQGGMLWLGSS